MPGVVLHTMSDRYIVTCINFSPQIYAWNILMTMVFLLLPNRQCDQMSSYAKILVDSSCSEYLYAVRPSPPSLQFYEVKAFNLQTRLGKCSVGIFYSNYLVKSSKLDFHPLTTSMTDIIGLKSQPSETR
jgi:hypothetical protein